MVIYLLNISFNTLSIAKYCTIYKKKYTPNPINLHIKNISKYTLCASLPLIRCKIENRAPKRHSCLFFSCANRNKAHHLPFMASKIISPTTAMSSAENADGKLSEKSIWDEGGNSSVPLPYYQTHCKPVYKRHVKRHIAALCRGSSRGETGIFKLFKVTSKSESQAHNAPPFKLSLINISPRHFCIGQHLSLPGNRGSRP